MPEQRVSSKGAGLVWLEGAWTVAAGLLIVDASSAAGDLAGLSVDQVARVLLGLALVDAACGLVFSIGLALLVAMSVAAGRRTGAAAPWLAALPLAVPLGAVAALVGREIAAGPSIARRGLDWLGVALPAAAVVFTLTVLRHALPALVRLPATRGIRTGLAVAMMLALGAVAVADAVLWPRLYPRFHDAMTVALLLSAAALGAVGAPLLRRAFGAVSRIGFALVGLLGAAFVFTGVIPGDDNLLRLWLLEQAPHTSRLLGRVVPATDAARPAASSEALERLRRPVPSVAADLDSRWPDRRRFNVVLVTLDTVRADHVSHLGYERRTTPALDALAEEGVTFERAYSQYASTMLSAGSMLTGLYPTATEMHRIRGPQARPADPTLPGLLREAGWKTIGATAFGEEFLSTFLSHLPIGFDAFNDYPHKVNLGADVVASHALNIVAGLGDEPYFLWLHFFDPHAPYTPHAAHDFGADSMARYDGEIAFADHHMGRVLDALRARDDWNRTIVIAHSDHGEEFWEHGGRHHSSTLYDEQVRVPLVIRAPGLAAGRVRRPVEMVDVMPTVLDFVGTPAPPVHGHALTPFLVGRTREEDLPPPVAYMQFREALTHGRLDGAVIGASKVIHDLNRGTWRVFDLDADPAEKRNVALTDPALLRKMQGWLAACAEVARRPFATSIPRSLEDMSHEELVAIARTGELAARTEALIVLGRRGRPDLLGPLLIELLDERESGPVRYAALTQLGLLRHRPAVQPILDVLETAPSHNVTTGALWALGAIADPAAHAALRAHTKHADPGIAGIAWCGLGLAGRAEARSALERVFMVLGGEVRLLAAAALSVVGDERSHAMLCDMLAVNGLPSEFQVLQLHVAGRRADARALGAWYLRILAHEPSAPEMNAILDALEGFAHEDRLPLYRLAVRHRDAAVRARAEAALVGAGRGDALTLFRRLNEETAAVSSAVIRKDFAEAARRTMTLLGEARAASVLDWGLQLEAWSFARRAGDADTAARAVADVPSEAIRPLLARCRAVGAAVGEPRGTLKSVLHDGRVGSRGGLAYLYVVLRAAGDVAVPGTFAGGPYFRLRVLDAAGATVHQQVTPLAVPGVLPGEERALLLVLDAPPLAPGRYTIDVMLRSERGDHVGPLEFPLEVTPR